MMLPHIPHSNFLLLYVCTVHGFKRTSYSVLEDEDLEITFSFNVKGTTPLPGAFIRGVITSQPGDARKLLLYDQILF